MTLTISPLLKNSIITLGAKRKMLQDINYQVETLVVGSSHGDFGFDPSFVPGSFNLCCRSQDLKHSLHLYKHIAKRSDSLKNLIIFYSIFSPGNFMERSESEQDICPALNEIFKLNIHYTNLRLASLSDMLENQLDEVSVSLEGTAGFFPTTDKTFFPESYSAQRRANDHLKINKDNSANLYLLQTILKAHTNHHRIFIIIPPARSDFKTACSSNSETLFSDLLLNIHLLKQSIPSLDLTLLDFFSASDFKDEDFGDFDHLHPMGAGTKHLSQLINLTLKDKSLQKSHALEHA